MSETIESLHIKVHEKDKALRGRVIRLEEKEKGSTRLQQRLKEATLTIQRLESKQVEKLQGS